MKFMNMCLFHFGWLFSICAVLLLLFWLSLPEVCARTYKLLGACSCVLSFKAEFFLRNKKQLIWLKCNSFTTFWITELSAFPLHTGWMLISPRKFNTKYQTNRKIKFYFNTLQIADCSDLQKKRMFMFGSIVDCESFTDRPEFSSLSAVCIRTYTHN